MNASSPNGLVKEIKRSYKGYVSNIYYQRGFHILIKTETDELDMVGFTPKFMCAIDMGDSIYKEANENYVTIVKPDNVLIKTSYLYINPSYRNDWRWPDEWDDKWKKASCDVCDTCRWDYRFEKYK